MMYEFAGRLSRGAFASGAVVMVSRRMLVVLSHPINPVLVGPVTGVELVYRIRGINLDGPASLHYLFEGETNFLTSSSVLEGNLEFDPINSIKEIRVTTRPLSLGAVDKVILLTFSGASGATFVGDPSLTTILKSQNVSASLRCNPDSFVIVKDTIDNVLDVLRNDTASAPISILSKDNSVAGLRIATDNKTLLMNAGSTVRSPFNFNYTALVPTTGETASAVVTLEVEDLFTAQNVSVNIPYNSSRLVNVLDDATPEGKLIVSAIGSPSDANASAIIPDGGGGIRFTVPRDADTAANSSTLSFTVRHTRTGATLTRTLTVTYSAAATGILRGNPGPLSRLPWYSGGTHNDFNHGNMSIQVIRGKKSDISCTFGQRGKGNGTDTEEWTDIRGGEVSGIKIQGCNLGLAWAKNRAILDNENIVPIITYDQWPFAYKRFRDNARRDVWLETAAGTHACGTLGTTDDLYDAYGAKLKRIVENYGWPAVVIRMNHECNGTASYPHFVQSVSQLDAFIAATRRCITRIKAAATSTQFQLFFCQNFARNTNGSGMAGPDAWVGKNYCDILELDFYDRNPPQPITDVASMNRYLNNTRGTSTRWKKRDGVTPLPGCNGPATWADFARQQGVGFAVGEWGVMDPAAPGHDGAEGDNPVFIEGVWNFFNDITDILWYECYFTQSDSTLADWPLSRAKYKALWGAGSGGTATIFPGIVNVPTPYWRSLATSDISRPSWNAKAENNFHPAAGKGLDLRDRRGDNHIAGEQGRVTLVNVSAAAGAVVFGFKCVGNHDQNLPWQALKFGSHGTFQTGSLADDGSWDDKHLKFQGTIGAGTTYYAENFALYNPMDGIDTGDTTTNGTLVLRSFYVRGARDDCIQNDQLRKLICEDFLIDGTHFFCSQRPGGDLSNNNDITFRNGLIRLTRQRYFGNWGGGGTASWNPKSLYTGRWTSPTIRGLPEKSAGQDGYGHNQVIKDSAGFQGQVIMTNVVIFAESHPLGGPATLTWPAGTYTNVFYLYAGETPASLGTPPAGVTYITDRTVAFDRWMATRKAWLEAHGNFDQTGDDFRFLHQ